MTNPAGPGDLPDIDWQPVDGVEVKYISGHQYHVATGEPNPCIHERMWWATQPAELNE